MRKKDLEGKVAIILGAAGGIGQETARLFDQLGITLVLADINKQKLDQLTQSFSSPPLVVQCDITDINSLQELFTSTFDHYKRIDFVINAVGIIIPGLFSDITYSDIHRQMDINLLGAIQCIKEALPFMHKQGFGHIITIASLAGIVPETYSSIYTATKFALRGLNLTLNLELKPNNILTSAVFPDSVDTPMLEFEARNGGSPLTFLDHPIHPIKVAKAILKVILKRKVEICVPQSQGVLSKLVMCFPRVVQKLWPVLEKKGEKGRQKYLASLEKS